MRGKETFTGLLYSILGQLPVSQKGSRPNEEMCKVLYFPGCEPLQIPEFPDFDDPLVPEPEAVNLLTEPKQFGHLTAVVHNAEGSVRPSGRSRYIKQKIKIVGPMLDGDV